MGKKRGQKRVRARASWKGSLSFGLVSFPVQAFNAVDRQESDIHFHQLHAECHRRIKYQRLCPLHGPVSSDEIVSGFEYQKGRYVEVDDEELDELRTQEERTLKIDAFVDPERIDPIYFDGRMYYLFPDGNVAEHPFAVLNAALLKEERVGIGQVVFSGKYQLALVRPLDEVLHMAMLNYQPEIRSADQIVTIPRSRPASREVKMAQTLIRGWGDEEFDFADYEDRYREKVQDLIDAKIQGRSIEAPSDAQTAPPVVNLMEALRQSVAQTAKGTASRRGRKKRRSA